jgi:hypothetical protein
MHPLRILISFLRRRRTWAPGRGVGRLAAIRAERGFALVFALLILVALTVGMVGIGAAVLDAAHQSEQASSADSASGAAAAGAEAALFRLNTTGTTTAASGSVGSNATYTYAVSTLSSSSSPCAGLWVQNSGQSVQQDCIISTGTVNGVSERIEERVVAYTPTTSLFPVNGLMAVNGFSGAGAVGGTFSLGSNGQLTFTNQITMTGQLEYPAAKPPSTPQQNECSGNCVPVAETTPIVVPTVPATNYTSAQTTNNDAAISWPSGFTYNASTHIVTQSGVNNATVNFPAGTYYYCGIDMGGGSTATIDTTSWPVKIYIDSTTGGRCTSGSGSLTASNGLSIANSSGIASNVQLYFYGNPPCTTSCTSSFAVNSQSYDADVYAPYSAMTVAGGGTFTGVAVIGEVTANGALTFTYQAPSGSGSGSSTATYYPSAHTDCIPPTTAGGTSGTC